MTDKMREAVAAATKIVKNPHGYTETSVLVASALLEQAAKSYPKDKPVECANGCPDKQVCDYCQSTAAAMMPCGASVTNVYEAYEAGKQAAKSVPVVGDVLFFASDSTATSQSQIRYDVCTDQKDYSFFPLIVKPTHSITAAELERLRKDAERYAVVRDSTYCDVYMHEIYLTDDDLDAAIDAAIAGERK